MALQLKALVLPQSVEVQFPAFTWQPSIVCKSHYRDSNKLLLNSRPFTDMEDRHAYRQSTNTCIMKFLKDVFPELAAGNPSARSL